MKAVLPESQHHGRGGRECGVFEVIRPVGFFNPNRRLLPDGTGTGVPIPEAHLKGYAIRQIDGRHRRVSNILITNQFGTFLVDTISPRLLLVPTAKIHLEDEPDEAEAAFRFPTPFQRT